MIMGTGILSKLAPEQKGDIMSFSRKRSFRSFFFIGTELFVLVLLCLCLFMKRTDRQAGIFQTSGDFIKWVDFNVTCEALEQAFRYDVDTCQAEVHLNWVDLLAYLGTRYGGDFSRYKKSDMKKVAEQLINGEMTMEELTSDMKYYDYYRQAYGAVLDGMVGTFQAEIPADEVPEMLQQSAQNTDTVWVTKYGLKAFFPLAKNFPYNDFDDFGVSRSYGFKRRHLGHDMMGQVGTPIIAVESGYVEALGWNQYGGWRIGIRSFDKKRYYYYAHLRKNYPFQSNLKEGSAVQAGDVIGYMGRTGYSSKENTNNVEESHLHFGLELVFDESQKESDHEIWINCYELVKFLRRNQCEAVKVEGTKEWRRVYQTKDVPTA
jgi:murein DD-endopeptidase MepM/ murein hydrolase activator NlpD